MTSQKPTPTSATTPQGAPAPGGADQEMPIIAVDMPILYEDEGQEHMGDSHPHSTTIDNIKPGLIAHLAGQPQYRVFSDINTYYHRTDRWAYVSADLMVVVPTQALP